MRFRHLAISAVIVATALLFSTVSAVRADNVPRISTDELKSRLGDAELTVLDVRTGWDWTQSPEKIAGAVRVDPRTVQEWAGNYPKERTLVLYCAWMNEATSVSVALQLIKLGYTRVYALKGGWHEWQNKGYPVEAK